MFCVRCGRKNSDESLFCAYCGKRLVHVKMNGGRPEVIYPLWPTPDKGAAPAPKEEKIPAPAAKEQATPSSPPEAEDLPVPEMPATETPPTETPATETPPTEAPPTETPPTETPATETPPTETPPTETPPTETPPTETPPTEAPPPEADENAASRKIWLWVAVLTAILTVLVVLIIIVLQQRSTVFSAPGTQEQDMDTTYTEPMDAVYSEPTYTVAGGSGYIPAVITQVDDNLFPKENRPEIDFYPDYTCSFKINYSEWMYEQQGTYEVYQYDSGMRIISCDIPNTYTGEETFRFSERLFLQELSTGGWRMIGQAIGMSDQGAVFTTATDDLTAVEPIAVDDSAYSDFVGDWEAYNGGTLPSDTLTIRYIGDGLITYDISSSYSGFFCNGQSAVICPDGSAISFLPGEESTPYISATFFFYDASFSVELFSPPYTAMPMDRTFSCSRTDTGAAASYVDESYEADISSNEEELYVVQALSTEVLVTTNLNVREQPNTDCEILGLYECGTLLSYDYCSSDGWYAIPYGSRTAYINGDYVLEVSFDEINSGEVGVIHATTDVNIRSGPGTDYSRIDGLGNQQKAVYVGYRDGWYEIIIHDGQHAYIYGDYVEKDYISWN